MTVGPSIGFEAGFAAVMVLQAGLALWHALARRGRRDAVTLLLFGVAFGTLFPLLDINLLGHYRFVGAWTVAGVPLHLGLTWFGLYYLALSLAEAMVGPRASDLRLALATGALFGLLECHWDPVLLASGHMELFLPSYGRWPLGFNPGLPTAHFYLGFCFALVFRLLRGAPNIWLARLIGLTTLSLVPVSILCLVPLMAPIHAYVATLLPMPVLQVLDVIHFSLCFAVATAGAWWLYPRAARRLLEAP